MYLAALVAVTVTVTTVNAVDGDYFESRPDHCMASTKVPTRPRALEFCYWHNDNSCCTPGNDALAKDKFYQLLDIGPGCAPSDHWVRATYAELRDFFCMGCHPSEPKYRFQTLVGDAHLGGENAPDLTVGSDDFTWRICASWLYDKVWGADGSKFDQCGINLRTPCSDHTQVGYDPSTGNFVASSVSVLPEDLFCGDDTVIPSSEYGIPNENDSQAAARAFLSILPQWLPDFKFVVVNDSAVGFNYTLTPCFGYASGATRWSGMGVAIASVLLLILL